MAKINSGVLGGFSGKLASVEGYRRNGKDIITGVAKIKSINSINNLLTNNRKIHYAWIIANYYSKVLVNLSNRFDTEYEFDKEILVKRNFQKVDLSIPLFIRAWTFRDFDKEFTRSIKSFTLTSPTNFSHSLDHMYQYWKYYNWNWRRASLINSSSLGITGAGSATQQNRVSDSGNTNAVVAPNYRLYFIAFYNTALTSPCSMIFSGRVNSSVPNPT